MKGFPEHATVWGAVPSPVGELVVLASEAGVAGLFFGHRLEPRGVLEGLSQGGAVIDGAAAQLAEYFAGRRRQFEVPLDLRGTEFQLSVWEQLRAIPFGEVASYRDVAERIDNVKAVRAVGLANGSNPVSVIVPCHRVIGADGSLTGFGGGLKIKRWLLEHEGAIERELFD